LSEEEKEKEKEFNKHHYFDKFVIGTIQKEVPIPIIAFVPNTVYGIEKENDPKSGYKRVGNFKQEYRTKAIMIFNFFSVFEENRKDYFNVINEIFELIDLIEILKAFSGNKLNTEKEYIILKRDNTREIFRAKIVQRKGIVSLSIHFNNFSHKLYLDKFESSSLASKIQKVSSKCEVW